jgi:CXXX repeat peptide maturase
MPKLGSIFVRLAGKFRRLNICLADLGQYREEDFGIYRRQLELLADTVAASNWSGGPSPRRRGGHAGPTECNLVTDRLVLGAMNNCDAGVKHITVSPAGRFYICPGFYYWQEAGDVGSLDEGLHIGNAHLLTTEYAPICRACDAYHCRRCVLLNKQLTQEINTPSRQQCVGAHCEREASRRLLDLLGQAKRLNEAMPPAAIPPLDYLDPFELIRRENKHGTSPQGSSQGREDGKGRGALSSAAPQQGIAADHAAPWNELRALLVELRDGQQEIVNMLRQMKGSKATPARSRRRRRTYPDGDKEL